MRVLLFVGLLISGALFYFFKKDNKQGLTIAFYNVENLFDTQDDPSANDEDYLPGHHWTEERYQKKLENLAEVMSELGDVDGPEIIGLAEVENSKVISDLISSSKINTRNYKTVHYNSRDPRGIDIALLYKPEYFKPFITKNIFVKNAKGVPLKTRDILLVGGVLQGDSVYVLVNHWPSRLNGQKESEEKRMNVSRILCHVIDSLNLSHGNRKIIVMGDFNDEPTNKSIKEIMKLNENNSPLFINPFSEIKKEGRGSVKFKNHWEMFDQIIISKSFSDSKKHKYLNASADVYDPDWLHYKENPDNGPYRTFSGSKYMGGYSDHFPVFIQLEK